jgi:phosphoribosyl 1,2-cyclic phosphodiesterase
MKFEVVQSSSKGNLFIINNDLAIDIGCQIPKQYEDIRCILLTHSHNDHLNFTALRKAFVAFEPMIICGEWLADEVKLYDPTIVEVGKVYHFGDYVISPVKAYHDIENCGYRIMYGNHKHIHITDTSTLEGITAKNYDSASIECNHCEITALKLIEQAKEEGVFTHLIGAMNSHLSVQKAIKFCDENNIKELFPVHIGGSTSKEVLEILEQWTQKL